MSPKNQVCGVAHYLACRHLNVSRTELERDLDHERKKVRELQEAAREQNKEYQKLKVSVAQPSATNGTNVPIALFTIWLQSSHLARFLHRHNMIRSNAKLYLVSQ